MCVCAAHAWAGGARYSNIQLISNAHNSSKGGNRHAEDTVWVSVGRSGVVTSVTRLASVRGIRIVSVDLVEDVPWQCVCAKTVCVDRMCERSAVITSVLVESL